jgi:hypothetical protein
VQRSVVNNVSDTKQPESLKMDALAHNSFPPAPPEASLCKKIINDFCNATKPSTFEEARCAVGGEVTLKTELFDLNLLNIDLTVLNTSGLSFTQKEQKYSVEPISELDGPVIDTSCHYICISCKNQVRLRKIPKFALARGL